MGSVFIDHPVHVARVSTSLNLFRSSFCSFVFCLFDTMRSFPPKLLYCCFIICFTQIMYAWSKVRHVDTNPSRGGCGFLLSPQGGSRLTIFSYKFNLLSKFSAHDHVKINCEIEQNYSDNFGIERTTFMLNPFLRST